MQKNFKTKNFTFPFTILVFLLLIIFLVAMIVGSYPVTLQSFGQWLGGGGSETLKQILFEVRLPRVILGLLVGACLGLTGPLLQSAFRTSLADPYLLGLAGQAAVGAVLFQVAGYGGFGLPVLASLGALEAAYLVSAWSRETSSERRALVGAALAAISVAGLAVLLSLSQSPSSANIVGWVVGGFYALSWPQLWGMVWLAIPAIFIAMFLGRVANVLQLGDDMAENLGIGARSSRRMLLVLTAVLTGVATGTAGLLGFVGLLAAGIARNIFGSDYKQLLPAAALVGAIVVMFSDVLGRTLLAPNEIPAGAFTTVVGGLYLAFLSRRAQ